MRSLSAPLACFACLVLGVFLTPLGAGAQAPEWNWRYCRLGEPCWDRLIEQGDRTLQDKMREAQAAAARIRNPDAAPRPKPGPLPERTAKAADAAPVAGAKALPAGVSPDDMRYWSADECATRYDQSAADRQECIRFVNSDAAKQARVDRACRERHPQDAPAYERCRVPLQSDATAAAAAAVAAAAEAAAPAPTAGSDAQPAAPAPAKPAAPPSAARPAPAGDTDGSSASLVGALLLVAALVIGAVAVRCWKPQLEWPQVALASCLGLLSGLMFYLLVALTLAAQLASLPTVVVLAALIVGWAVSVYIVLSGAVSVARVVNRGFLLGAVEWMLMIPAGLFYASRAATANLLHPGASAQHGTMLFGTAIGGDLLGFVTGGIAVVMAGVCLVGFAVTYFISGQLEPQFARAKRKCPECAEMIQAEATKCRYCNAVLKQPKAKPKGGPKTVTRTPTRPGARAPARADARPAARSSR